jgi:hypothetical protein
MKPRLLPKYTEPVEKPGVIEQTIDHLTRRIMALRQVRSDLADEIDALTQQLDRECYLLELSRGPVDRRVHAR